MPIRINLKELFPADAQEITIDKINFNFNKLLALGVGDAGPIGLSGIQGSAGPVGGAGSQGVRGSTWIVDSGAPTITTGLLDGDLYLDSNALAVYQWDEMTSTWTFLFDISAIVQNYLNAAASPFVRGFGAGSPDDQRFIVFGKKDGTLSDDFVNGSNSTNDVLFLSNYDEAIITPNPPVLGGSPDTTDFYGALLNISVDQRSLLPNLRSHLELGMLYDPVNPTLTSISENFKVRYDRIGASKHIGLDHYNRTAFSLDVLDSFPSTSRNFSSVFAFESPKYQPLVHPSLSSSERSIVLVGSRYGLDEEAPSALSGDTLADGIVFYTLPADAGGNIGTAVNYSIAGITGVNTGYFNFATPQSHFMLDPVGTATSLYFRGTTYQNEGNLVQLGTTAGPVVSGTAQAFSTPVASLGHIGIAVKGDVVYTFGADTNIIGPITTQKAYFNKQSISNPNSIQSGATTDFPPSSTPIFNAYVTAGKTQPDFAGISDITITGELMYVVNNQSFNLGSLPQTYFQILKLDEIGANNDLKAYPIQLGKISNVSQLSCAHRVELAGRYAIIATNALPHSSAPNSLDGPAASGYDGRILAVDIDCTDSPTLVASAVATKAPMTGTAKSAFMDLVVVDNYAYTLTWQQQVAAPNVDVRVHLDAFDISNVDSSSTITWKGRSNNAYFASSFSGANYSNLSKTGAIDASSKYLYSSYSVYNSSRSPYDLKFQVHDLLKTTSSNQSAFQLKSSITISTSQPIKNVVDLKHIGNSVYVLGNTASNQGYVYKVDVSNESAPFKVWEKQITYNSIDKAAGRFTIVGKHIYVAAHDTGGGSSGYGGLIAIDFDGIYSGGAHIESLRADEIFTIGDAVIGQHLTVNSDLNVGNDAQIGGTLGIGSDLSVCDDLSVGGDATVAGNLTSLGNITGSTITANQQFIGPGTIPLGGVIMWSGLTTSVPAGWALCNGAAVAALSLTTAQKTALTTAMGHPNLPSLADRFIVGAGSTYPVRLFGGQDQITLTRANIPAHKHKYAFHSIETGDSWNGSDLFDEVNYVKGSRAGTGGSSIEEGNSTNFDPFDYESNTMDGTDNFSNELEVANGTGTVTPIDNKPLYCALAYIIRIY